MARIPVRFKRVGAVFDEEARARLCESSGSEYSAETLTDLSYLVNSFIENEQGLGDQHGVDQENYEATNKTESKRNCSDYEIKDSLKRLLSYSQGDDHDEVKKDIHGAVEKALLEVGNVSSVDFKRLLMARLRRKGFDAGLCKSKWEKNGNCPSGDYEYIDVYVDGTRYFIEVSVAKEFIIARPTGCYEALLDIFPQIFVGKQDELKQVTRLMCSAIKKSMKSSEIHVPPWRRLSYMQAKWFSSFKRTINEAIVHKAMSSDSDSRRRKRSVGFVPVPAVSFLCREDFSAKVGGLRVGNLAAAFNDNSILS